MRIANVKLNELVTNRIQPEYRTDVKFLQALRHSIKLKGLITPILVDESSLEIIDGHRRAECYRLDGMKEIPCVLVKVNNSSDAWIEVNSKARAIRRKDYVGIYMKGGNIPKGVLNDVIEIVDVLGKKFLDYMNDNNLSTRTVSDIIKVANKLNITDRKEITKFFNWGYETKSLFAMSRYRNDVLKDTDFGKKILNAYKKNIKLELI